MPFCRAFSFWPLFRVREPEYMKGYVRMPRNGVVKVANITDDMRASLPVSLDWSTSGATTPVKDQGQCGSCWAYSATEGIESGLFMVTGTLTQLSEQQIIPCDKTDLGCNGGDLPTAFQYIETSGGIETQSLYPDTSSTSSATGTCKNAQKYTAKVTDWAYAITPCPSGGSCKTQAESDLVAALNTFGPLSVCVNAGSWNSYTGGTFSTVLGCSGAESKLDHCVQLVGYDTAQQYWKLCPQDALQRMFLRYGRRPENR